MSQRTRKPNLLSLGCERLEERMLFSLSGTEQLLQAAEMGPTAPAQELEQSNPLAPVIRGVTSSSSTEITLRNTTLRVNALADSSLRYQWSLVSAPPEGAVTFNNPQAAQTGATFTRAGLYTLRVDVTDEQGRHSHREIELNFVPTASRLRVFNAQGDWISPTSSMRVQGGTPTVNAVFLDQFGQPMPVNGEAQWSMLVAPEGANAQFESFGTSATVRFDQLGWHTAQVSIGSWSTTIRFDVRSLPAPVAPPPPKVEAAVTAAETSPPELSVDSVLPPIPSPDVPAEPAKVVAELAPVTAQVVVNGNLVEASQPVRLSTTNRRFSVQTLNGQSDHLLDESAWIWTINDTQGLMVGNYESLGPQVHLDFKQSGNYRVNVSRGAVSQSFSVEVLPAARQAFYVSNAAELTAALRSARGGEEILLQGGVDFGMLKVYKPANLYQSPVTIRSEDVNHRAILQSVVLTGAQNITISDVKIVTETRSAVVTINGSTNVQLKNSEITANHDPFTVPEKFIMGVSVRGGSGILIEGNLFHRLGTALGVSGVTGIEVLGNEFRENQLDSMTFGSNVSDVMIRGNTLFSQLAGNKPGHHYDNIQFWVQTDATQNSRNISILDNAIYDLTGAVRAQAIFARGDYVDASGIQNPYGFENFVVAGNVIVTQQLNAIAVNDVHGLRIHNNTLVYAGDQSGDIENVSVPGIRHSMSADVAIFDNILPMRPNYPVGDTDEFYRNTTYNVRSGEVAQLLVNPLALTADRQNFAGLNIAALRNPDGSYRGALVVQADANQPTASFSYTYHMVGGQFQYQLDANHSLPASGLSLEGATYLWRFADGTQASGPVVNKVFTSAGLQSVQLTVTDAQGRSSTLNKQGLLIKDPRVLALDFEQGLLDGSGNVSSLTTTGITEFTSDAQGGAALKVGGQFGHLYLSPDDTDMLESKTTRELSLSLSLQVEQITSTRPLTLFSQHGSWSVSLNSTSQVQFAVDGRFHRFRPPVNLVDGQWHDIAVTMSDNQFSFFIGGTSVYQLSLTPERADTFWNASMGLGIGGSGPWAVNPLSPVTNVFHIDNLQVRSHALAPVALELGVLKV